jgi:3-isopropylmalate dehydrogenase
MKARIAVLPGDGIGPEVTRVSVRVLGTIAEKFEHTFSFLEFPVGGASLDLHGIPLTEETYSACAGAEAILLGAVGGPRWGEGSTGKRPEEGLLALRKRLGLFANLRPIRPYAVLASRSPVKKASLGGVDFLVVRELTGGLYFGEPRYTREEKGDLRAVDTLVYTAGEIRRVSDLAFRLARGRRKKVTLVDKANVLETSRLWRKVVREVAQGYPDVGLDYMLVDTAAMRLITAPECFDVLLTENMFGDILTDEASVLTGSLGMVPSASLGEGGPGLYEPIHGSAPDIAGKGVANPIGSVLSAAMLLRHSLGLDREAGAVERAVERTILQRHWTPDLGGTATTDNVGEQIILALEHPGIVVSEEGAQP